MNWITGFVVTSLGLATSACAVRPYPSSSEAAEAIARLPVLGPERLQVIAQISCKPGATRFDFPIGEYIPTSKDKTGIYYMARSGIYVRPVSAGYFAKGGFIVGEDGVPSSFFFQLPGLSNVDFPLTDCQPSNAASLIRVSP